MARRSARSIVSARLPRGSKPATAGPSGTWRRLPAWSRSMRCAPRSGRRSERAEAVVARPAHLMAALLELDRPARLLRNDSRMPGIAIRHGNASQEKKFDRVPAIELGRKADFLLNQKFAATVALKRTALQQLVFLGRPARDDRGGIDDQDSARMKAFELACKIGRPAPDDHIRIALDR